MKLSEICIKTAYYMMIMIQAEWLSAADNSRPRCTDKGKYRAPYIHCSQKAPILQSSDLDFLN